MYDFLSILVIMNERETNNIILILTLLVAVSRRFCIVVTVVAEGVMRGGGHDFLSIFIIMNDRKANSLKMNSNLMTSTRNWNT